MSYLRESLAFIQKEADQWIEQNKDHNLYQPIAYILSLGGKRLRPALTILAARVFGAPAEQALKPALGIEVFHNFTLMHDDIMDKAPLRRGSETVHVKWDVNAAILSGDAMLVQAYQLIAQSPSAVMPEVLDLFSKTALEVCEGQQLDMDFEQRKDVSVDEYIEMIRLKTSVLLAASLEIGALVGGSETADAEKLYRFGEQLGIAFQLRDDYLDVFGESSKVGKQSGGDILADKKTFLLIRAYQKAKGESLDTLNKFIGVQSADPVEKVDSVRRVMQDLEVDRELLELSDQYYQESLSSIAQLSIQNEYTKELIQFAAQLMERDH